MPKSFISYRILISLLKKNGVKKLVLSSGMRNIPFVNAVEADRDFECFSVVDERSAAFFGMGLSQQSREPVVLACTSGTAVSNYLSGVTESYYSHVPLIVVTFDRSPYALNQLETQKIDHSAVFSGVCKKSVTLPVIKDDDDIWYCTRLINEAMIALCQRQAGPVHINIPLVGSTSDFYNSSFDYEDPVSVRQIKYIPLNAEKCWEEMTERLLNSRRVLVVMGQTAGVDEKHKEAMDMFFGRLHCPLLADNLCNYRCDEMVFAEAVIKAMDAGAMKKMLPEIVITFGCNFQERIKDLLKANKGAFEHWSIEPEGVVRDVFKSQTALFECTPEEFFERLSRSAAEKKEYSSEYLKQWKALEEAVCLPEMPFTNFYVVKEFSKAIPAHSVLHLSILNSTRLMQFFKLDPSIQVYSNVNAFGIDGCLPAFMGQAYATDQPAFLVIGDLSFFYGMNALDIRHRKNNIRILLINNGGGAEFHIQPESRKISTLDRHIGAEHRQTAEGWALSAGYEYLSASDQDSFAEALSSFTQSHDRPVLLEVFTDMKKDGEFCLSVYREAEKSIARLL